MDTQQIVYKILGYCTKQYPDLDWSIDSLSSDYANKTVISGDDFPFKVTLKICSDKKNEVSCYEEETTDDYIIGHFDLINVGWLGMFGIQLNCDKKIDFRSFRVAGEWNEKDWLLFKQYQKTMLDIFNFIVIKIQE